MTELEIIVDAINRRSKKLLSHIRNIPINFVSLVQYTSPLLHKSLNI